MADDLKRVGLIFKEDGAVDFKKSLQEINLELNKNYNQFKLVQSQWDASTKSTEKLRAEQEYLKNAYEIQNDKVSTLRMQLIDLENAENKDTTAIKKKRNELTAAEVKLETYNKRIKELESQLHNAGKKIEEFGQKVKNSGDILEKAGKKMSAFSAATAGALAASAKSAIDFEEAFTGVEKTVDGTEEQMTELKKGIRDMAKEIPSTTTEIAGVAEAAGQLGIKTEDILEFTKVMIDLGNSTNLSADEAASSLAKFANITQMSAKDYSKLGSAIVALGNNFATTEADIVNMATNLASTGELTGLTEPQIMALATAMSSVGIEAQAGGTAMSKLLKQIQLATELGGEDLKQFSSVAGMTSKEFKQAFEKDAVSALSAFISGLNNTERNGKSAIAILADMDIKEARLSNTILSLANSGDLMNRAIETGNKAWENNTALTNESNKRYETLKSKITITLNKLKDMAITVGNKLMPVVEGIIDEIDKWIKRFDGLSDKEVETIVNIGLIVAATSPLLTILGKITSLTGGLIKGIGNVTQAIGVMRGTIQTASATVNGLATVFSAVTSPVGLAVGAIVASVGLIAIATANSQKQVAEHFTTMGSAASDFVKGIATAKSHLNDFNTELFASSQEQQELRTQMDEVQKGITTICKRASDERRGYTQEEITQLEEYFTKLRELNQREIEIQNQIAGAITQQAVTAAETFKGSLEEYKVQSQEWINTAQEQAEKTKSLIEKSTIEEVALLNQKYGDEANMQNEAYSKEYNKIIEQKQKKIDEATKQIAEVSQVFAKGYEERTKQEDGFYNILEQYAKKQEEVLSKHNEQLKWIKDNEILWTTNKGEVIATENRRFANERQKTWEEMYKNMSDEQSKELGVWLGWLSQTEVYGGQISDINKELVDSVISSYDSMPSKTKEAMKNAMSPMITEMQNAQPILFTRASGIADGILSRLKKSFDIHSPSRKTRAIFKNVMKRNGKRN